MNRLASAVITTLFTLAFAAASVPGIAAMDDTDSKRNYQQEMQERINDLRSRTQSLQQKITSETPDMWERLRSNLQNTQQQLDEKWEAFKETNSDTWRHLESGINQAVDNVEEIYQTLEHKYFVWSTQNEIDNYQDKVSGLEDNLVQMNLSKKVAVQEKIASINENAETVEQKLEVYDKSGSKKQIQQEIKLTLNKMDKLYKEVNQDINTN